MKLSFKIIITFFVAILFVSQVNSVFDFKKKNNIFNLKNEKICKNYEIDISSKMKEKHIQEMSLSCEISASADILSFLMNKKITEKELLKYLPKSDFEKLPQKNQKSKKWGNPENGFVGYIDKLPNGQKARQRKLTGYGVLEKPIEKIFHKYGFKTTSISQNDYYKNFGKKEHLKLILENLEKGNMVQLWGDICTNPKYYSGKEHKCFYNGKPSWNSNREISWNYKDKNGNLIKYRGLNGEHAFYLLGYKGDINNPSYIIVWDTYTGKHIYPTSEWMRKWGKMQYRSIIVYKK